LNDNYERDPRLYAIPDTHGHAKGEHKPYLEERPLPLTARMLFLWFYHACRRGFPRFLMVADHMNYLTFEDPAAVNLVRRALKLAQAGDLYGAAETANVDVGHAAVVSEGLRRGMRYSIGAEVDNDPRSRPDAQNIVDAMRPDGIVRSVHFIPITHPVHGENWQWPFDNPEFSDLFDVVGTEQTWELYVTALVDAIERLPGHIVGHFFVPAVFGHWPDDAKLGEYEDRVLAAAEARGMAIEFNTRFFYRDHDDSEKDRYLYANKRLLRKARDRGVAIAIGSDAHSPKDQGGAFDVVLLVLDELEINEIVFPMGGVLRRVALRVVREPEPEPVPEPAPPEPQKIDEVAPEPAKPVRKARAVAKATRPPQTSPERPPERPETSSPPPAPAPQVEAQLPAPEPADGDAPAAAKKPAPKKKPAAPAPVAAAPAAEPVAKPPAPAKAAPERKPAAKPAAKPPAAVKPSVKAVPAKAARPKAAPAKPAAKAAAKAPPKAAASARHSPKQAPAKKAAPAKAGSKKAIPAKAAAKKASPARPASKKSAPARKGAAAKKPAPKKSAPARTVAKKAAPKKVAPKKAPARGAPARKAATKKTTAKKTAAKRR
jgi:HisJ family histidinol phosphate phosphatase